MRTIRTKIYKFNELSNDAKKVAIEWYRSGLHEDDTILFFFKEHCEEIALEQGFEDIKLQYSLSYCQGDGLSFSGTVDLKKVIPEIMPNIKKSVLDAIVANCAQVLKGNDGRYCFASRSDFDLYIDTYKNDYPNVDALVAEIRIGIEDKYLQLCKELEKTGYDWIEDESIIDNIIANEYEFTKDGNRFH